MRLKDYYKTLNVPPTADTLEIRKAFRQLALQYHPDRNQGDLHKAALFREVQEAYEILSDTKSREEYNYKRWYTRSLGKSYVEEAVSPQQILAEAKRLADYISMANTLQLDYDILSHHIRLILSEKNIGILGHFNDSGINQQVVKLILRTAEPLPYRYVEPISLLASRVAASDNTLLQEIHLYTRERGSRDYWENRRIWLVILASLLICWLMYLYASGNK